MTTSPLSIRPRVMLIGALLGICGVVSVQAKPLDTALEWTYQKKYSAALGSLANVSAQEFPDKPLLKSVIYLELNQPQRVVDELKTYRTSNSDIREYAKYLLYRAQIKLHPNWSAEDIRTALPMLSNPYLDRRFQLDIAMTAANTGRTDSARVFINQLLSSKQDPVIQPKALQLLIELELQRRDHKAALQAYGRLLRSFPDADRDGSIKAKIQKTNGVTFDNLNCFSSPDDALEYLKMIFIDQRYSTLIEQSEALIKAYPRYRNISDFYLLQGMGYFYIHRYKPACAAFENALNTGRQNTAKATFFAGESLLHVRNFIRAIRFFTQGLKIPGNPYEALSYFYLCKYTKGQGSNSNYEKLYKQFEKKHLKDPVFKHYQWEESPLSFQEKLRSQPAGKTILAFYKSMGEESKLPLAYSTLQTLNHWIADDENQVTFDPLYQRLYQAGLAGLAIEELATKRAQSHFKDGQYLNDLYAEALLTAKQNKPYAVVDLLTRNLDSTQLSFGDIPRAFVKLLYPQVYWPLIVKYSTKYHVDPYLVLAIIREESKFNPKAISKSNAYGLMQIQPGTARELSFRLGIYWKGADPLLDPEINIKLGVYYISHLEKMFNHNTHVVLAAYNAGPDATFRWVRDFGKADFNQFVNQVSYPETQSYIRRVMNSYLLYKILYS